MNGTTKRFEVTADQLAAISAAEKALQEIARAFHAANPDALSFSVHLWATTAFDYSGGGQRSLEFRWSVGGITNGGEGKEFALALERFHQQTDADLHRARAKRLRQEAERLEKDAAQLEGKTSRRTDA